MLYAIFFDNLKSPYLASQPTRLRRWLQFKEEIVLYKKNQVLKASTSSSSHKSNHDDQVHRMLLKVKQSSYWIPKAHSTGLRKAPGIDMVHYTRKNLQQIIEFVLQA